MRPRIEAWNRGVVTVLDRLAMPSLVLCGMGFLVTRMFAPSGSGVWGAWLVIVAAWAIAWRLGRLSMRLASLGMARLGRLGGWAAVIAAAGVTLVALCWAHASTDSILLDVGSLVVIVGAPVAALAADAGWIFGQPAPGSASRALRVGAFTMACLSVVAVVVLPFFVRGSGSAPVGSLALLVVLCLVAHALLPSVVARDRRRERELWQRQGDRALATLQCPRCLAWLTMHSGSAACPRCALHMRVEFEEPRCGCGYPLHRLAGPNCPECGFLVPPERRWGAARGSPTPPEPPGA
jgi:hypothetical protein